MVPGFRGERLPSNRVDRYFRALLRAQEEIDLQPERLQALLAAGRLRDAIGRAIAARYTTL